MTVRTSVLMVLVLAASVILSGCLAVPGGQGWKCDADLDCRAGLRCHWYSSKRGPVAMCSTGAFSTRTQPYGWGTVIAFWTVVTVLPTSALFGAVRNVRRRRKVDP